MGSPIGSINQHLKIMSAVLVVMPIFLIENIPSVDLPNHIAISSVIKDLILNPGETNVGAYYALNQSLTPYHLVYALLTPFLIVFGVQLGSKLFLGTTALLFWFAAYRLTTRFEAGPMPLWGAVYLVYSLLFFWGFVATWVGIPFLLLHLDNVFDYIDTKRTSSLVFASVFGLLAGSAHLMLVVALGWIWLSIIAVYGRQGFVPLCTAGFSSGIPMLAWVLNKWLHGNSDISSPSLNSIIIIGHSFCSK